jgi:ABC-type transporter Mla subunit MlaD
MRRVAAAVVLASVLAALVAGANGDEDGGTYRVRGVFDHAAYVVTGEDVKVAGAEIGKVESLDVTAEQKAAISFRIDEPGFSPFHTDARCSIRQQSLIGEKFIECTPGSDAAPLLDEIPDGEPGAGEHLLPLEQTSSPVDLDLVNDMLRLPFRQRLALTINTFGTGLAGRGSELNEAIHRANPALRETDRVLAILAAQDRRLADLTVQADRVIEPLARRRREAADFVDAAAETATATAERGADLARSVERLPAFLRELRPTLRSLGSLSDEMTPLLADLGAAAPDITRFTDQLGPLSRAGTSSLVSLGDATTRGLPALLRSEPTLERVADLAADGRPVARRLDLLTKSLDETGGVESALDYVYFQTVALNGFDEVSHYLRAGLIANLCSGYSIQPSSGCNANFQTRSARSRASAKVEALDYLLGDESP